MPKIVTVAQMRAIEQAADAAGHSYAQMMELAGGAVATRALELLTAREGPLVLALIGPGNNGGDGLVAARKIAEERPDADMLAYLVKPRPTPDPNLDRAVEAGVQVLQAAEDADFSALRRAAERAHLVLDAIFGTSLRLPIRGSAAQVLQEVGDALAARRRSLPSAYHTPSAPRPPAPSNYTVLAVDCPSGVNCDSGEMDAHTLPADETITFAAAKPGLLTFPAAERVGVLHIGAIGLPPELPELAEIPLELASAAEVAARLPTRPQNAHKGTFGKALVVAGSANYIGAAYLSAAAAYKIGAGWVTVGAPEMIVPTLAGMLPEATWLLLPHELGALHEHAVKVLRDALEGYSALLVGPGLGQEETTAAFLREFLRPEEEIQRGRALGFVPATPQELQQAIPAPALPPLVLDASALYLLAQMADWPQLVPPQTVLTPHPGEFARLAGMDVAEVQADRVGVARAKAAEWRCVVVLKGAFTVIAAPSGAVTVLPFATPALATAGTGDVLAGAITGLLAQGLAPYAAAVAGAYVHGLAGVRAGERFGLASTTAGDVLRALPEALGALSAAR